MIGEERIELEIEHQIKQKSKPDKMSEVETATAKSEQPVQAKKVIGESPAFVQSVVRESENVKL